MDVRAAKRSAHAAGLDDKARQYSLSGPGSVSSESSCAAMALTDEPLAATKIPTTTTTTTATTTGEKKPVVPRKRKRRVISCAECHRRKQKCDRGLPCRACVDRKMEASCHYETVAMSRERHHTRVSEAAVYGRALQEGGDIQVKTAGLGYTQSTANTLGFLHKIDGGQQPPGTPPNGSSSNSSGADDGEDADAMAAAYQLQQQHQQQQLKQQQQHHHHHQQRQVCPAPISKQPTSRSSKQEPSRSIGDPYGMGERYRALVRELPPLSAMEHLAGLYFKNYNWNYYAVDRCVFFQQLADWTDVAQRPFGTPQSPAQMAPDLRAFPALLFQVIASGLLGLDASKAEDVAFFESIKRPTNSTFEELAHDYSETGMAVLSLLGKRQMSYTTVLAGFIRSAFLKYVALITEAWHALGMAIRDAQEVGLHRPDMDPKPWAPTPEAALENEWEIQRRRRLWMILASWDMQMGIVLGRPTSVDVSRGLTEPIDCVLPKTAADRSTVAVRARAADDPPTPLSRVIWAYKAIQPLRSVLELEKEGPSPRNVARVDEIHEQLVAIEAGMPPYFRLENPDTRFDDLPDCDWLRSVRATMPQIPIFNFMALHRQYIFTRPKSRTEALKACLRMLEVQRVHFALLRPQQYKTWSLFFGTFDSLVLLATIYIMFPKEHRELLPDAIQHYRWSMARFEVMMEHYGLVRSALSVLQANYLRMRKALGASFLEAESGAAPVDPLTLSQIDPSLKGDRTNDVSSAAAPVPGDAPAVEAPQNGISAATEPEHASTLTCQPTTAGGVLPPLPSLADAELPVQLDNTTNNDDPSASAFLGPECATFDSIFPDDFDWTSLPTLCPTGDLTYNVLTGVGDKPLSAAAAGATAVHNNNAGAVMTMEGGAGGLSTSMMADLDDATNAAAAAAAAAATEGAVDAFAGGSFAMDGAVGPWQFEGDFSSFSVWGLLNQYSYTP